MRNKAHLLFKVLICFSSKLILDHGHECLQGDRKHYLII